MIRPLVSVITPVYNMEKLLSKCIESVINQTYKNLEYIIIDDGSKDNSGKICDRYAKNDGRIKVVHKENGGIATAFNVGLDNVNGDFVTFVDSDDYISPIMIETLMREINNHRADIVQCEIIQFYDIKGIDFINPTNQITVYDRIGTLNQFFHQGKTRVDLGSRIYRRSLFDDIRFPEGRQIIDVITAPRLYNKCNKYVYLSGQYYYVYSHASSMSHSYMTDKKWDDYIYANKFFKEFITQNCPEFLSYVAYWVVNGALKNSISISRSSNITNKTDKYKKLREDFLDYYSVFEESEYFNRMTKIEKIRYKIYKKTPFLYMLMFDRLISVIKTFK